jgi:hypothetical protein
MTRDDFIDIAIKTFGDWKPKKGEPKASAEYRKERFIKAVSDQYDESDLFTLWELVEKNCEYMPTVKKLNELMPGRKLAQVSIEGFERERFELMDQYTTQTGGGLGMVVEDFMQPQKIDKTGLLHNISSEEKIELVTRSSVFWNRLSETLKNIPDELRERIFFRERCRNCGKRLFEERRDKETYCDLCGMNINAHDSTMKDAGGGNVGEMLSAPAAEKTLAI